jgi:hypothetical protein
MASYFKNSKDLHQWIKNKKSAENAATDIFFIINPEGNSSGIPEEQSIIEACNSIYQDDDNASDILFKILSNYNLTTLNKRASCMKKEAQTSRQRNKWNRVMDGFNENTPWRVSRDKYFDFTHYYTDEIKFDEDPNHIYSGESIWRTYVMDKFYRDYQDENGKVVGGYINDRFYVFPTAGTPDNPDVPRDGGNPMNLTEGERSRKPRPHEYSVERRLEEARGNKLESITASSNKFEKIIKVASRNDFEEITNDRIYNMFVDTIEMREAGIDYETMIDAVSEHYNASVTGVAQIDKIAQNLVKKHNKIGYQSRMAQSNISLSDAIKDPQKSNFKLNDPRGAIVTLLEDNKNETIYSGTSFVKIPNSNNLFQITDVPDGLQNNLSESLVGKTIKFDDYNVGVETEEYVEDDANDLGLNEENQITEVIEADEQENIPINYI